MISRKHRRRNNVMMNGTSINLSEKKCGVCGSAKTDIINKEGTLVFNWLSNPYRKGTLICGNCNRRGTRQVARIAARIRDRIIKKKKGEGSREILETALDNINAEVRQND
jgi:predicted ATPase